MLFPLSATVIVLLRVLATVAALLLCILCIQRKHCQLLHLKYATISQILIFLPWVQQSAKCN